MKISFVAYNSNDASPVLRALWPSMWINKFTDHSASFITQRQLQLPDSWTQFINTDVVVLHKQGKQQIAIAEKLKKVSPRTAIVFDTDDRDELVWDYFLCDHWFLNSWENWDRLVSLADGVTCASIPLCQHFRDQGYKAVTIENGFDLTLSTMSGREHDYWSGDNPEGRFAKVVYAGGSNHYRELGWLIQSGIFERVCNELPVDFYIYGIGQQPGTAKRTFKRGTVTQARGASIDTYIQLLMHDAQFLLAPLLNHPFNDYRSTVKLVEAGVARKTIIASDNQTYGSYIGRENVTLLPEDADAWVDAITRHVNDPELCRVKGEKNRAIVEEHYDAQILTKQRIDFYQQLLDKK